MDCVPKRFLGTLAIEAPITTRSRCQRFTSGGHKWRSIINSLVNVRLTRTRLDGSHALAAWRMFTVSIFDGVLGEAELDDLQASITEWRAHHPGKTVDLAIIYPTRAGMTAAQRKKWLEIIKCTERQRVAGATVILAEGMLGSVHRGIVTSFNLLAPPPHPVRVFGRVSAALTWLSPYLQDRCGAAPIEVLERDLTALADEIRAARRETA